VANLLGSHGAWSGVAADRKTPTVARPEGPTWAPNGPGAEAFQQLTPTTMCKVLTDKGYDHVFLYGDSIVRQLYWAFVGLAHEDDPQGVWAGWQVAADKKELCYWKNCLGLLDGKGCRDVIPFSRSICGGRVQVDYTDIVTFGEASGQSSNLGHPRSIAIMGLGFHEMYVSGGTANAIGTTANWIKKITALLEWPGGDAATFLRRKFGGYAGPRMLWLGYHPRSPAIVWHPTFHYTWQQFGSFEFCNYMVQDNWAFHRLNRIAETVLATAGCGKVDYFDVWNMVAGVSEASTDGTHYLWWVVRAKVNSIVNLLSLTPGPNGR
jgi:hypothetical protein